MGRSWNDPAEFSSAGLTLATAVDASAQQAALDLFSEFTLVFTATGTVAIAGYLLPFGSVTGSDTLGPKLPWQAELTSVMAWKNDALLACQLDVRAGSTVKYSASFLAADLAINATQVGAFFSSGDIVNVKVAAVLTGGGGAVLMFRRRSAA